jgi:hypothetical protein
MAKINTSGSGKSIYGQVPGGEEPSGAGVEALKQAFDDLDDSFSSKINGPINDKRRVEYDPENGK